MSVERDRTLAVASPPADLVLPDQPFLNPSQIDLVKTTICKGSTDDELRLFLHQCERTRLDPFARQIYAVKRWDQSAGREVMRAEASVDGLRLVAERTGRYEGQTEPLWCGPDGVWGNVWLPDEPPSAARVGVHKTGFREPTYGVATFRSFAQRKRDGGLVRMWSQMADHMLAKCAESLALRKAFPHELSGLYSDAEVGSPTEIEGQDTGPDPATQKRALWNEIQRAKAQLDPKVFGSIAGIEPDSVRDWTPADIDQAAAIVALLRNREGGSK